MLRSAVCCVLLIVGAASAGPVSLTQKSFPAANCSFALPDRDWEWLDPKAAADSDLPTLAFARNRAGLNFILRHRPLKAGEAVDRDAYTRGLRADLRRYDWEKVAGKHVVFKGVPSYQVDVKARDAPVAARFLVILADNQLYTLYLQSPRAELGPEADAVFDKFAFLKPPTPMLPVQEGDGEAMPEKVRNLGEHVGEWLTGLGSVVFVLLILFGAWIVIRLRG